MRRRGHHARYMGSWKKGERHGQGRLNYADGVEVYYEGDWMFGKKHGHGKQVIRDADHGERPQASRSKLLAKRPHGGGHGPGKKTE